MKRVMTIALLMAAGFLSAKSAAAHVQPSALLQFVQNTVTTIPAMAMRLVSGVIFPEN